MPAHSRYRPGRTRIALAAAVTLAAAGVAGIPLVRDAPAGTTLAMGPAELSPSLAGMVDDCLDRYPEDEMFKSAPHFPVTTADLAVAVENKGRSMAIFLADGGYFTCDRVLDDNQEESGGYGVGEWEAGRDWLPGPIQVMEQVSSEIDSGWVMAGGRVSYRVERLTLEHGNGTTTRARLANGAFGLITNAADVEPDAELVAYDSSGEVIERDRLFEPLSTPRRCYTDPTGEVIHSKEVSPDASCLPAVPWKR